MKFSTPLRDGDCVDQLRAELEEAYRCIIELTNQLEETKDTFQHIARTDSLTEINNRRYLMERLAQEIERFRRYGSPVSLLIVDLDHFKRINDTYGHVAGDQVLARAAQVIVECIRDLGIPGRLGGDEFCAVLSNTPIGRAQQCADRLRERMADQVFTCSGGDSFQITCSIGVAQLDEAMQEIPRFLDCADRGLYEAKRKGRNRVCVGQQASRPVQIVCEPHDASSGSPIPPDISSFDVDWIKESPAL
jgi:diguanylate cyclase (GGDEF)-like protein